MPEWKSFTFGEGGEAVPEATPRPPPAPSPADGGRRIRRQVGTEVAEVSIARIENVLEGDGLPHGSSEFIAVTQLEDVRFQIHREPVDAPGCRSRPASSPRARATPSCPSRLSPTAGTPSTSSPPSSRSKTAISGSSWPPRVSSWARASRTARFTRCCAAASSSACRRLRSCPACWPRPPSNASRASNESCPVPPSGRSGALSVELCADYMRRRGTYRVRGEATGRIGGLESTRTTESAPACRSPRRRDDRHDTKSNSGVVGHTFV